MPAQPIPSGYHTVTPHIVVNSASDAIEFYKRAFGAEERARMETPDGSKVMHAEMTLEDGVVMMGTPGPDFRNPKHLGQATSSLYVYVDDVDAHCTRAREAGAEIIEEPADQPYGDRRYGATDPEGHVWYFASHLGD